MSRNGSGTYTLPAGNPVVTGTTISTTWANNTLNDIAATLTDSVAADGQTPMTGDLDLNSNKIVSLSPAAFAGEAVEYSQFISASSTAVAITGGTINGTTIGETTRSSGKFTTLQANAATTLTSTLDVTGVATFAANSQFNGTGALKIPAGTTGQQPTPVAGMIRYNSTTTLFEGYGSSWTSLGGGAAGSNTQIQYNNSGVLAGSSNLTFNGTTLTVPNLSDGTSSISTGDSIKGAAKAYCSFAGASGTIAGSFNISSVTRNGVGDYTANFTTALPNANYTVVGTVSPVASYASVMSFQANSVRSSLSITTNTTSSFQFSTVSSGSGGAGDCINVYFSVFSA